MWRCDLRSIPNVSHASLRMRCAGAERSSSSVVRISASWNRLVRLLRRRRGRRMQRRQRAYSKWLQPFLPRDLRVVDGDFAASVLSRESVAIELAPIVDHRRKLVVG